MLRLVSLSRLLAGGTIAALLLVALYLFALREPDHGQIEAAVLLDTPSPEGAKLDTGIEAGKLAPNFEISTPSGERLRLSELRGRPVVINFWATWCGSCLSEMPELKAVHEQRGLENLSVLALNAGETPAQAATFIDFLKAPFVYGLDLDLTVADAYGVHGLPLSVFIDSTGVIQTVYRGHADRARLDAFTDAAIKAQPPGDFPVVLRLTSTIPRERVLLVRDGGEGRIEVTSRALRCDTNYCATSTVEAFARTPGVFGAEVRRGAEPGVTVRFDRVVLSQDQAVERLVEALSALRDPVYTTELIVRYE